MSRVNSSAITIRRAGQAQLAPEEISTGHFWFEDLLPGGCRDGDFAAIRADLPQGVITRWHSHPQGQLLYVISGIGLVQEQNGAVQEVRAGDAIWFGAGIRHWHGAKQDSSFSYISVQGWQDGRNVNWCEEVEHSA